MKTITEFDATYNVGQNSSENDQLYHISSSDSFWFHLEDMPSPHVYVTLINTDLNRQHIVNAANLVRKYSSKAKLSKSNGRVMYAKKTDIKLIGNGEVEVSKYKLA